MNIRHRVLHALIIMPLLLGFVADSTPPTTLPVTEPVTTERQPATSHQMVSANNSSIGNAVDYHMILGLGRITAVAVSSDGKKALLGSEIGLAVIVDLTSGAFERYFFGHTDQVNAVAFSPNGTQVLTGSDDGTARLWNASTGELLGVLLSQGGTVNAVAFSPDGTQVLTGDSDNTARLWNAATGALIRTFTGHIGSINGVAFSPDGTQVLTGSSDTTARLWNAATGALIRTFTGHIGSINGVAFSPDGTQVLTGSDDATARLWNASTGALLRSLEGHTGSITSVAYSPATNNPMVVTGSEDGTARLWNASTGTFIRSLTGHTRTVNAVTFFPDGTQVLTGSADYTARLWNASTGQEMLVLAGHTDAVTSAVFSPDGQRVLTGSADSTTRLWDAESGQIVRTFISHTWGINAVAFSPDGTMLLAGGDDGAAQLWNANTGALIHNLAGHAGVVTAVDFAPDGQRALTGSDDHTVRVWDLSSGQTTLTITKTNPIADAVFSPDGTKILIATTQSQEAYLHDANTGALIRTFTGHTDEVSAVAFSPDGAQALTGSADWTARLWDVSNGQQLRTFTGLSSTIEAVAFSPDGKYILGGSGSGYVALWDSSNGTMLSLSVAHARPISAVAFSANGQWVLTSSDDATARIWKADVANVERTLNIRGALAVAFSPDGTKLLVGDDQNQATLWDVATGQKLRTLTGHTGQINAVAFSPDGSQALTGSDDYTARLWDLTTGHQVRTFNAGLSRAVTAVAFSPDGSRVLTGDTGGTVYIWSATTGEQVGTLSSQAGEVRYIAFTAGGNQILTWSNNDVPRLWDLSTGQVIRTFGENTVAVNCAALSPDGKRVLTGSSNGITYLWDTDDGQLLRVFNHSNAPRSSIYPVGFAGNGRLLFSATDRIVYLWDTLSEEPILNLVSQGVAGVIASSPTGTTVAISDNDDVTLWEFEWQPWSGREPTALTLGTAVEGTVGRYDWADYYAVPGAAGQSLLVTVTPLTDTTSLVLYARRSQLPTISAYDHSAASLTSQGIYELLIQPTQNITYYLGVFGSDVDALGHFRIIAQTTTRHLADVSPRSAGNAGDVTLNIQGLGFEEGMQVELRGPATLQAATTTRLSSTTLIARFNLRGAATGTYDLYTIWPGGGEKHLSGVFAVRSGSGARLAAWLDVPTVYRSGTVSPIGVNYANIGDADMPAPLLIVSTSPAVSMRAACHTSWHNGPIYLLGVNPNAPANTLVPDARGNLPLSFVADQSITVTLETMEATNTTVNWATYKDAMRPAQMTEAEWNTIWPTLTQRLGNTWSDYLQTLGENAERLRQRRQINYCVDDLLFMEVRRARGDPTAAIVGQLINAESKEPLGGVPVVAYQITTTAGTTPTVRTELSDLLDGYFVLDGLSSGRYQILAEGYYFTPTVTVEITNDTDVTGLTLLAYPIEEEETPVEEPLEVADHKPALAKDNLGNVHMVWQRGEEIWHSVYSNSTWTNTLPISGATGVEPVVTYAPTLIGTSSPGMVVVWQEGFSNTARIRYALGRPDASGVYSWTLPLTLTNDNYGDIAPVIAVTGTQNLLVLWLQRDWSIEDDLDLYYTEVTTIPIDALVWVRGASSTGTAGASLEPATEGCVAIRLKQGTSIPKWVPIIGGRYGFEINGQGCTSPGCEPGLSAGLELGVEFSDRVSGSGSFAVTANWETDAQSCRYIFGSAEANLSAGAEATIPLYTVPVKSKNVTLEVGGTLAGQLDGSLEWTGANFPSWPSSGKVDIAVSAGPYGTAKFYDKAEVSVSGKGSVKLRYVPPARIKFVTWCIVFSAEAKVWILTFSLTHELGPCGDNAAQMSAYELARLAPQGAMVMYSAQESDGVPSSETLVVTVNPLTGTNKIYGGNPVLSSTISSDLTHDGKAAVARSSSGEILAAWTKDSPDPNTQTGSSVVVAAYNGNGWSTPVEVQSAAYFNRHTALAFDSSDVPMLLWASAPATVTLSSPVTDVLDAIDNADIYFSRRVTTTWSTPTTLLSLPGRDENVRVATDDSGNAVAAWINTVDEITDTLYTAFWNGSTWYLTATIPVTGTIESLDIAYAGTTPLLVWSQDTDGDATTHNDLTLFYSTWNGSAWAQPAQMPKQQSTQVTTASEVKAQWLPPFKPPQECCDQDDDDDKPKPPDPPQPPKEEKDKKASQVARPVDPNEKSGPQGVGEQRLIGADETLEYTVYFENVVTATAPAQQVVIVDYLSPYLDWSSFRFKEIAFGDQVVSITDEGYQIHTRQLVSDYRLTENKEWWVDIIGEVNPFTGRVQWTLSTLDPATGQAPTDPLAGFLPPNDDTGRGEGHVSFTIRPRSGLVPGTRIVNSASITFDNYETIKTNEVYNVIAHRIRMPIIMKNHQP